MTTAFQVIAIARSQIGVRESPPESNYQKYGAWYGWNGVYWCDQYLSWCFAMANALNLIGGKSASVALTASRMRTMGRYGANPTIGGIAFFNDYTHIELITGGITRYSLNTIGGNTSGAAGSISNGGGVFANTRSRSLLRGYGVPAYAGASPVQAPAKPPAGDVVVDGVFGSATIMKVQRWVGVAQDGGFGLLTKKALQRKLRVTADGNFGRLSILALQRTIGTHQDGVWGSGTTRALQIYMNRIF